MENEIQMLTHKKNAYITGKYLHIEEHVCHSNIQVINSLS